ncbi:MAG: hypothetical protein IKR72_02865 [Bacteroidales bacterium]|nr:hypothetical protein [Bacteroidales bacterium]
MNTKELKSILREIGIAIQQMCIRICRNTRALWLRILLGIRHKDEEETLRAIVRMTNEGIWLLCWLLAFGLVPFWVFQPSCFLGSIGAVILAMIFRTINIDEQLCK